MKKLKYLIVLILTLVVSGSIYIGCITSQNPSLLIIMPIYQIVSILAICGYVFLVLHHNNEIGKAKVQGKEIDTAWVEKRKTLIKWYIALLFPFVLVTLCDYIYLLLLADNPFFQNILKFF